MLRAQQLFRRALSSVAQEESGRSFAASRLVPFSRQQVSGAACVLAAHSAHPQPQLFEVVADVERYYEFVPFCTCVPPLASAPSLTRQPERRGSCAESRLACLTRSCPWASRFSGAPPRRASAARG